MLLCVGGYLLQMSGRSATLAAGQKAIAEVLMNGMALQKFQAMLEAQGVAAHISHSLCSEKAEYFKHLRRGQYQTELQALDDGKHTLYYYCGLWTAFTAGVQHASVWFSGTVLGIDGMTIATVLHELGAGRNKAGDPINHGVGAELLVDPGQHTKKGE